MSHTTYPSELFRAERSFAWIALAREIFAATPLGILVAALKQRR